MAPSKDFPTLLENDWKPLLKNESKKDYFQKLRIFLQKEYKKGKTIFPPKEKIFTAIEKLSLSKTKVVIIGQDPYHNHDQALGLSFAVPNSLNPKPPSLQNIFKEINADLKCVINPQLSDLSGWHQQGILLLNTVLTVEAHKAHSHRKQGWEEFTDRIIEQLDQRAKPLVFMLWGNPARKKKELIQNPNHLVLESVHPSPLSAHRGFFGCHHFSKANQFLKKNKQKEIDWAFTSVGGTD